MSRTLAVIGAGAKAVAVAAKAAVLRECGVEVPDVVAIERRQVGANWYACGGWTDGQHRLGTSPEKDVGFPYRSSVLPGRNADVDARMMRLSWQSYLVAIGQFAEWIDRGRPAPTHRRWGDYLTWVASSVDMQVVSAEAIGLSVDADRWIVDAGGRSVEADAVMVTGPGQPERSVLPENPKVLSIAGFWRRCAEPNRITAERVAVIGGGETAASVLNELFGHRVSTITVISPQVTLFTRGEGYFENTLFSDPTGWLHHSLQERQDALSRTDRGVFSARVQESLLADDRIRHLPGRVAHAVALDDRIRLTLRSDRAGEPSETVHGFDLVIDGAGADSLWFLPLFDQSALDLMELRLGAPVSGALLQESLGYDLAVAGLTPTLYLPTLAGLTQGPGFPNLSCLGLLSDRILGGPIQAADARLERKSNEYQPI